MHPPAAVSTSLDDLSVPRYERVRLALQARIADHVWDAAAPIPTEQVLSAEFDVSVGTIRKAVERLVKDGLLVKVQGKGTFIKRPDFKNSLLRFFRYRNQAGEPVVPTGVVKQVDIADPVSFINQRLGLGPADRLIHLQRVRLVEHAAVLSESIWLPYALFAKLADMPLERFGNLLYPFYDQVCGQFVSSAVETLSFVSDHTDEYLGSRRGELLVKIERIARNLQGGPIEYRVSYGRPQNFRYEVRIN
ncbi:UTRA domain-containing protein [Pusillimonas sp. TS35]|uniref:GntR family transcriptional regulator n=1 Tax=Paracandidimonas lactea TaxID=2895524 RepID=UPI0013701761|nr:GntR family transcriptional regulator [Paracandidimonas lactea]MYN13960.1 UTRA domain-containing protein [Pusillimonas sp. TS35]